MKLSFLIATISTLCYAASALEESNFSGVLVKRDHGIPYSTLPSTSCAKPSTCSNISGEVTCRCSETLTTCVNTAGQYCWGSVSLNQTSCPSVPTSCSDTLTGSTKNCLCNSQNVLCIDNANNYCYGAIVSGAVSITPIPYAASSASASAAASATVSNSAAGSGMSVIGAPSLTVTPGAQSTSGSVKTSHVSILSLASIFVAYLVIH